MQAPLVATRAARPAATTQGHIPPPLDLAPDEIDIHAIAPIPRMIARGTPCEGRAQVVPVRVPAGITPRVVGFPPEEQERVPTHPDPGNATPDGFLVQGIKRLEALHQSQPLEVGGTGRGGGLGDVRVDLACGHDGPIEHKLGLLCRGQPLYRGVIRAPGEYDHQTEQHTYPAYAPWPPSHSTLFIKNAQGLHQASGEKHRVLCGTRPPVADDSPLTYLVAERRQRGPGAQAARQALLDNGACGLRGMRVSTCCQRPDDRRLPGPWAACHDKAQVGHTSLQVLAVLIIDSYDIVPYPCACSQDAITREPLYH